MIKQPNGSCVTQVDQIVEQVHSPRRCVKECLRSNIDCQGVTYNYTGAVCFLSREITLQLFSSDISIVTYTTRNGSIEPLFYTTTTVIPASSADESGF